MEIPYCSFGLFFFFGKDLVVCVCVCMHIPKIYVLGSVKEMA